MSLRYRLQTITKYNIKTFKKSPLAELSGACGDLGTLLPLMIAMTLQGNIQLSSTLVFSGLTNIFTGAVFGIPLPVQPMKAIASVAISQNFSRQETAAAGLTMGIAVFLLSATGLLRWLNKVVPVAIVKGIQVGAGLNLVISAGSSMILPLEWARPFYDNRVWSIAAFVLLVIAALFPRLPYALLITISGLILIAAAGPRSVRNTHAGMWEPSIIVPAGLAWRTGAIYGAIPQLPLTTLNSILAVTSLSASMFPTYPPTPSTTSIGFSVAVANLVGCWFSAMPICHGSGGLAGQYRFGARSGASIIILGWIKLILGLFVGDGIVPLLRRFPQSLLGIMVIAAGIELAKVGQTVGESQDLWEDAGADANEGRLGQKIRQAAEQERRDRWVVMLVTVAGCLAFKNDAIGFAAGLIWHYTLLAPTWVEKLRNGSWRSRQHSLEDSSESLLGQHRDSR